MRGAAEPTVQSPTTATVAAAPRVWLLITIKTGSWEILQKDVGVRGQGGAQKGVLLGHFHWINRAELGGGHSVPEWEVGDGRARVEGLQRSIDLQGLYCLLPKHWSSSNKMHSRFILEAPPSLVSAAPCLNRETCLDDDRA